MRRHACPIFALVVLVIGFSAAWGQDVTAPAEVTGLRLSRSGIDVALAWDAVTEDVEGQPETVARYEVYRSAMATFPAYYSAGKSATTAHLDLGALDDSVSYYYLVSATDDAANEGALRPSSVETPPVLTGSISQGTAHLSWTEVQPTFDLAAYHLYYGVAARNYENVVNVGLATTFDLPLTPETLYFFKVAAVDSSGAVIAFSSEWAAYKRSFKIRAHDKTRLCPFGACPPDDGEVPRSGGQEMLVPLDLPEQATWTKVLLTYTVESNLCSNVPDKCGPNNPGWNPCGDPWDRTTSVTLAQNDCLQNGSGCFERTGNHELLRAITPFGTDAVPPNGTGFVPPRVWVLDVTPYASLLTGRQWISAMISTWVVPGWQVTADFEFFDSAAQASAEPPADGLAQVHFGGSTPAGPTPVTIPANAVQVFGRVFTTGHGGVGNPPCDEFCAKTVEISVDGSPVWSWVPWRTDCSPAGAGNQCWHWNACGYPSCTFSRAGWCPGYMACHHNAPCDNDIDLTSALPPGGTYDVLFRTLNPTAGGAWSNSLTIYWYVGD